MKTQIANVDASGLEKFLSGQAGFILATIMFGAFFWKVLLPRFDALVDAVRRLANAIKIMAVTIKLKHENATGEEVADVLDGIDNGE